MVPKESFNEEDYIIEEVEIEKHGAMYKYGYVIPFLFEYSDEKSMDETTLTFLKQVRENSGYEVDCKPNPCYYESPFTALKPDNNVGKRLAEEAIKSINRHGERYELVELERYVRVCGMPKLLTLLVKDYNGCEKRLRVCMMKRCQPTFSCYLYEWKDVTEGGEDKGWRVMGDEDEEWKAKAEKEDDVGMEVEKGSIEEDRTYDTEVEVKRLIEERKRLREEMDSIELKLEKMEPEQQKRLGEELESIELKLEKMEPERKRLKLEDDSEVM